MRLVSLSWLVELGGCKPSTEKCFEAAAQVGTNAPPSLITVPKTLTDDPRFAEARRLTQVAREQCTK